MVLAQMQSRRGTAADWSSANPVLAAGEIGLETDTGKTKMGNGGTTWNLLSYWPSATGDLTVNDLTVNNIAGADAVLDDITADTLTVGGVLIAPPTPWTTPTFTNNWDEFTAGGYQGAQYRKIGDMVYLRGALKDGDDAMSAFTLPPGFRIPTKDSFPLGALPDYGTTPAYLDVFPDGTVVPNLLGASNGYVGIAGISFSVTA